MLIWSTSAFFSKGWTLPTSLPTLVLFLPAWGEWFTHKPRDENLILLPTNRFIHPASMEAAL